MGFDNYSSDIESDNDSKCGESITCETKTSEDEHNIKEELTKKETTAVFRLRMTVLLVLVLAAAGVSITVLLLTRQAEIDEFEIQYDGSAQKILDTFDAILKEMAAISGVGVAATAHSVDHHIEWPYLTLSNFQERAGNARELSKALSASISPLVRADQLEAWEAYVRSEENYWM